MYYCALSLLSPAPSGVPQEVNIVATGRATISIQWDAVNCTNRNSEISGYRVRYGPVNGTTMNSSIDDPIRMMYTATGLMNSTNYSFEVAAESSSGTGPFSIPIIAQTSELLYIWKCTLFPLVFVTIGSSDTRIVSRLYAHHIVY